MKRFCTLLLSLLMCAALLVSAGAETLPDLSRYTDDEILALSEMITQELVTRKLEKTASLPAGSYIAGKDIPAGSYIFMGAAKGDNWGSMTVYTMTNGKKDQQKVWKVVTADDPCEILITLEKGDELKCAVPFTLTIYAGILFR